MRIFFEPTETLLFRTGRPFDAGESGYAESIFPPTPETLQGALRAAIATHWDSSKTIDEAFRDPNQTLVQLIGDQSSYRRDNYGRFRITGIALGRRKEGKEHEIERLFPAPAYLLSDDDGKLQLKPDPERMQGVSSDRNDSMQFLFPERDTRGKLKPTNGWLTEESLFEVLQRAPDLSKLKIVSPSTIFVREPRVGIGMQNTTKTTEEGLIYQMHMIRMCPNYGFVLDIRLATDANGSTFINDEQTQKELHLPSDGWITLGGERRAASFEVIASSTYEQEISVEGSKKGTLLYLATPAYFRNGWQPISWPNSINPIAAAVDRFKPIGGWLLSPGNSGGAQKPVRHCVPAGSVYFFKQTITVAQSMTDFGSHIGYGITYAGEWKQ